MINMPRNVSNPLRRGTPKPKVGEVAKVIGSEGPFPMNEFVEVLSKQSGGQYLVESLITGVVATVKGSCLLPAKN